MPESQKRYVLRIIKQIPNPKHDPGKNYQYSSEPPVFLDLDSLSVVITVAQFEAIRKAAIEAF